MKNHGLTNSLLGFLLKSPAFNIRRKSMPTMKVVIHYKDNGASRHCIIIRKSPSRDEARYYALKFFGFKEKNAPEVERIEITEEKQ